MARDLNDIVLCEDETIRVVYQGDISPAKYVRALIPVPVGKISGLVLIKATICYKSQTDPHHPSNYTQAGLDVSFRPHGQKFKSTSQVHPNTKPFFESSMFGATEVELRRNSWKWETCFHSSKQMRGQSLQNSCFELHYNSRLEGQIYGNKIGKLTKLVMGGRLTSVWSVVVVFQHLINFSLLPMSRNIPYYSNAEK